MCGYSCAILFVLVDVVEKFRRGLDAGDQNTYLENLIDETVSIRHPNCPSPLKLGHYFGQKGE